MIDLLDRLSAHSSLSLDEWEDLISCEDPLFWEEAKRRALSVRDEVYGRNVFLRGLIEFTSFCRNDCYYCGLRRSSRSAERYRLGLDDIIASCRSGYEAGFRSFVLQGGEDPFFTDERMVPIVAAIRKAFPDAAITLSIGERSRESYRALREAGADRYLLRHETADGAHYRFLHPEPMSLSERICCLRTLKDLGYQTGAGMMIGSPGSSAHTLAEDMLLIAELKPEMVGIGPFIPHHGTPFSAERQGSVELTLRMLSIVRLLDPHVLLPSTTALGTADADGLIKGLEAGANVIMPNLTPSSVRSKYLIYDGKKISGDEAAENLGMISAKLAAHGYRASTGRGDYIPY